MSVKRYYEKVLGQSWPGMEGQLALLQIKCDSQLEILFGLAVCLRYHQLSEERNCHCHPVVEGLAIRLSEPFLLAECGGESTAYLIPQVKHLGYNWDYAIFTGDDNGYKLDKCKLRYLVEVDGYGIHKMQRDWDVKKSKSADVCVIRVIEERFKDPLDMADAVLHSTIMWCCKGYDYVNDKPEEICDACKRSESLLIRHNPEMAFAS